MSEIFDYSDLDDTSVFNRIACAVEMHGYIADLSPLPEPTVGNLFAHLLAQDRSEFKSAGIGRASDHQVNPFVRSDEIIWVDHENGLASDGSPLQHYLDWMENLRWALNRRLYLGLFDYECHYARYDKGAFYKRHLDAFKTDRNRVISTVLYLNPGWQPGDGGELVLYKSSTLSEAEPELLEVVQPLFCKMVIFLSEDFPHEVLLTNKPRYSLTGWFRLNQLDTVPTL